MSDDLLITPGSRKLEIKDSSGNVDAKIETDASGNLSITNAGGDISIGDTSSDIFVGDGTNNVDIVFEQDGEIRGTSGVTVTLGASGSNVRMASDLNLNGNDITGAGNITLTGNLNITGDINSTSVTDLDVTDKTITLGVGQTEAQSGGSGIVIAGSNAELKWNESNDRFEMNKGLSVNSIVGNGAGLSNLDAGQLTSGTLPNARLSSHIDVGAQIDIGVSNNFGTTTSADKLWISAFTTGQSDVPGNYYDIINISQNTSHGIQIASNYASTASTPVYIRTRSDNNSAPNGPGLQPWALIWTDRTDGAGSGLNADLLDDEQGSYYLNRANHTGTLSIGTTSPFQIEGGSADWNETTQGQTVGSLHLDPENATNNFGSAITFGASDTSNGDNAQAGIYVRSDGGYGTKMYFSTTNSYASGAKTFMYADHNGKVYVTRSGVSISGGALEMNNQNITGVNALKFNDPGPNEGIEFTGGNIKIYESPNDLTTNSAGNLQVVYAGTRRLTVDSTGVLVNGRLESSSTGTFVRDAQAGGPNALNLLSSANGNGVGITFTDNGTPPVANSGQRGQLLYYHGDGASYGSGNAFVFDSTETSLTVLAKGKLMTSGGLWRAPTSGTGAGTQMISSTGAMSNITSLDVTGDGHFGGKVDTGNLSVGAGNSSASIFRNNSGMAGLHFTTNAIYPTNNAGAVNDTVVDIGGASNRFNDLHLSGEMSSSTGHTSGKFAVKSTSVHASYDFYNNGTTYLNGAAIIDDSLDLTGSNRALKIAGTTRINSVGDFIGTSYYRGSDNIVDTNSQAIFKGGVQSSNARVSTDERHPLGHYTTGEEVFSIDPTWTTAQLREYFDDNNVEFFADSTAPDGYAIKITGAVSVGGVYDSGFPYIPSGDTGDEFYMECYIRNEDSNQTHYMGSQEFNESFGSLGGNPGSFGYWVMSNHNPGTSWTKVSGYLKQTGGSNTTGEFESGAKYFTPQALFNYTAGSGTRVCYISGWKCFKVTRPGGIHVKTTTDSRPAIVAENTGGISGTIQEWIGDSDKMQMINESQGDYFLRNSQQSNGIFFADGTGGVTLRYNNSNILNITSNVNVASGNFQMGGVNVIQSSGKNIVNVGSITASSLIKTNTHIQSGNGSGGVALTINDGYGNANVTFNHLNGTPEQNGQSGRIEVNTDATSGAGQMSLELSSSPVTNGSAVSLTNVMTLNPTSVAIPYELAHMGDSDTLMRFSGANQILHVVGGVHTAFMDSSLMTINPNGGNYDFRVEGDSDANNLYSDASTDRIGIGTASPTHPLHISKAVSNDTIDETKGLVKLQSSGGNGMILGTIASSPYTSYIQSAYVVDTSTAVYNLALNPIGGSVGVGTTGTLSAKTVINVSGSGTQAALLLNNAHGYGSGVGTGATALQFARDNSPTNGQSIIGAQIHSGNESETTSNPSNLIFSTKSGTSPYNLTEAMRITSQQRVGIGVTGPGQKLDVRGGNIAVGGYGTGNDYGVIFTPADSASYWHIYNDTGGELAFGRNITIGSSEMARFDSSGRFGIGTNNPTHKLHVAGDVKTTGNIVNDIGNSGNDSFIELKNTGYTGNVTSLRQNADSTRSELNATERPIYIQAGSGGGATGAEVRLYANQALGLRVDASADVHIPNRLRHQGDTNTYLQFHAADQFRVVTGGAERLEVNSSGVSIGTSSNRIPLAFANVSAMSSTSDTISIGDVDENDDYSTVQLITMAGNGRLVVGDGEIFMYGTQNSNAEFKFTSNGILHADNDVIAFSSTIGSDRKLKENIKPLENSLDKVLSLDGISFDWKDKSKGSSLGFIAQDVEKVLPVLVKEVETLKTENETHKVVNYDGVVPVLVEAMKEQQKLINRLEERIKELENKKGE